MKLTMTGLEGAITRVRGLNKGKMPEVDKVYRQVIRETLQYALEHTARYSGLATRAWVVSVGSGGMNGAYDIEKELAQAKDDPSQHSLDATYFRTGAKFSRARGSTGEFRQSNRPKVDGKNKILSLQDDAGLIEKTMQNNADRISRVTYDKPVNLLNVAPKAHIRWLSGDKSRLRDVNADAKSSLEIAQYAKSVIVPSVVAKYNAKRGAK